MLRGANNTAEIRSLNKKKIIEFLRMTKPATKKELSVELGLSFATVSNLCNQLSEEGIICSKSSQLSNGGKIPDIMSINPNRYSLALNVIGTEEAEAIITDVFGETVASKKISLYATLDFIQLVELCYKAMIEIIEVSGIDQNKILGIGIAAPGIYSKSARKLINSTNLILENTPLEDEFIKRFQLPVYIENETNLMVLATSLKNRKSYVQDDILYIYIGEGLGTGILCNGRLVTGSHGLGGEISHIPLGYRNFKCNCGNVGCIETELSRRGFLRKYSEQIATENANWQDFINAVIQGHPDAMNVIEENGKLLGKLTSVLVNLFDPKSVHIGGVISPIFDIMYRYINEEVVTRGTVKGMSELRIIHSEDYEKLIIKGCSELVLSGWTP